MAEPTVNQSELFARLKVAADREMASGRPDRARDLFQQALAISSGHIEAWLGLAACARALRDPDAAMSALESALANDPRCFAALLMKGSLLEAQGHWKAAAIVYGDATAVAPSLDSLSTPMQRALAHGGEIRAQYASELTKALRMEAGLGGHQVMTLIERRAETFIEAVAGRRKIYKQEPAQFHYPDLAAIEFHERDQFPWLEALEVRTDAIRSELMSVWTDGSPDLVPYLNYTDGAPLDQWAELNRSLDWSAYHLLRDGSEVSANCARCPATMAALTLVDQPHMNNRSPVAMFSILKPHAHIPPHTGIANTRLVLHLPLVVPEGCFFRVGGETRPWREGEAWVFDDTIEHEAWNDSDRARAILICDVWNPTLSGAEREMISRLLGALDRFNGDVADSGGL